jgi:hypothetical protein
MTIEAVLVGLLSVAHTPEQAEHAARTVLRDHAHQLAEQIRQAVKDCRWGPCQACEIRLEDANLIDPEVQR